MYDNHDFISIVTDEYETHIINNDRIFYIPYLGAVEKQLAGVGGIIGGTNGANLLLGKKQLGKNDYQYEVSVRDPLKWARQLADRFYAIGGEHAWTVFMETNISHQEFTIYVNTRALCKIYALRDHMGQSLASIIDPVGVPSGFFIERPLNVFPPELYLIEIAQKLYQPYADRIGGYTKYTDLYSQWDELYEPTVERITDYREKLGRRGGHDKHLFDFITPDDIIVGEYAISGSGRLQILSTVAPADLQKQLSKKYPKITFRTFQMSLSDFQLLKHTFYDADGSPLMDVYNSPAYELIPTTDHSFSNAGAGAVFKIGNPFVLLRFRLIDFWAIRLVVNSGKVNKDFVRDKLEQIILDVRSLHKKITTMSPEELHPVDPAAYTGTYLDPNVSKKRLIKESVKHRRYYPSEKTE